IPLEKVLDQRFYFKIVEDFLGIDELRLIMLTRQREWQIGEEVIDLMEPLGGSGQLEQAYGT
ncbi:MAG: hypothetical protein NTV48_00880, partial [Candidatus Vogelbacteria bacterium]|nr:hypothetical protein [Candidatus Vogelbacteria bacterium]